MFSNKSRGMLHTSGRRWPSLIICSSASILRVVSCAKYIKNVHETFLLGPSLLGFRRVPTMLPASNIELQRWSLLTQAVELMKLYGEPPSRRSGYLPSFSAPQDSSPRGKRKRELLQQAFSSVGYLHGTYARSSAILLFHYSLW